MSSNPPSNSAVNCTKTVFDIMSKAHSGFQICYINARSFTRSKLDYFNYLLPDSIDVVCVSETWFKTNIDDHLYNLKNFSIMRHDRGNGTRGGGIAIYFKKHFSLTCVMNSDINDNVEFLGVEVKGKNSNKCLILCVYNPHKTNNLQPFFNKIHDVAIRYDKIIVCGDFNVNLLLNGPAVQSFKNNAISCGLHIINHIPTRFAPNSTAALLDVMMCSSPLLTIHSDQLCLGGVSDHDLLFYVLDFDTNCQSSEKITYRDFKSINMEALFYECSIFPWSECFYLADVNNKLKFITNAVHLFYDKFVPIKSFIIHKNKPQWFSKEVRECINQRNTLYKKWKSNPSPTKWNSFRVARNRVHVLTRTAKRKFYNKEFNDKNLNSQNFWKRINKLGIQKKQDSCSFNAEELNEFFYKSRTEDNDCTFEANDDLYFTGERFHFLNFVESDVYKSIMAISSNAVGFDGINLKFIKLILPFIIPYITHVFNHIVTTSTFPLAWKIAKICPVPKKSTPVLPEDYRPISILSALSKVFEKLISWQIINHLSTNKLLTQIQSGFQKGKSCNTAVLKVLEDIRPAFDRGDLSILVLIDFSKAFDMVNFPILLEKLQKYFGFSRQSCCLMDSYLTGRSQYVSTLDSISSTKNIYSGVPQGSILGPILFAIFINDIVKSCTNTSIHLYADDAQIYMSKPTNSSEELIQCVNNDMANISNWATRNKLSLNSSKTQAMCIHHRPFNTTHLSLLHMNGAAINYVDSVKNLGFIIDSQLKCSKHVDATVTKIYNVLRKLWHAASFLTPPVKLKLIKTLITPLVIYGANVYGDLDAISLQKLQITINNCARFVYNKRKFDHISFLSHTILGSDLKTFLNIRNLLFTHKLITSKSPEYLYNSLKFAVSARTCNLIVPTHRYLPSSRMFFVNAARLWNNLPHNIKNETNINVFKANIFNLYCNSFIS